MKNELILKKVDESNFIECFNLNLGYGQDKYVSHPIRSLAQAYVYYNQCTPFAIYKDNGKSDDIILTCNMNNSHAIHIYKKLGFKNTGERDEDEIMMKLVI